MTDPTVGPEPIRPHEYADLMPTYIAEEVIVECRVCQFGWLAYHCRHVNGVDLFDCPVCGAKGSNQQ